MPNFEITVENQLLSALSFPLYKRLLASGEEVCLFSSQIVHQTGETVSEVYFPLSAVFSSAISMTNGSISEVAMIGKEGLVGLPAILGIPSTATNSVVQISGTAIKLSTQVLKQEFQQGGELQLILLLYAQAYIALVSHIAACNSLHHVEQRLARFLLLVHDHIDREAIPLTQKLISMLLGVRRASITETAISFQSRNIIQYSRGKIKIVDRSKLEAIVCECYSKISSDYQTFVQYKLRENVAKCQLKYNNEPIEEF